MMRSDLEALVVSKSFAVSNGVTICVLTLKNGYKVTGESDAAIPNTAIDASYNAAIGKMWSLERYHDMSKAAGL